MGVDKDFFRSTGWARTPLKSRLKQLHEHYCTGPCGQSGSTGFVRSNTSATLSDAIQVEAEAYSLAADLASVIADRDRLAAEVERFRPTGMVLRNRVLHLFADADDWRAYLIAAGKDWSSAAWIEGVEYHPAGLGTGEDQT
jgi:hypothetical protein